MDAPLLSSIPESRIKTSAHYINCAYYGPDENTMTRISFFFLYGLWEEGKDDTYKSTLARKKK